MIEQGLCETTKAKLIKSYKDRKMWKAMIAYALKGHGT